MKKKSIFHLFLFLWILTASFGCFEEKDFPPGSQKFCKPCFEDSDCCCGLSCLPFRTNLTFVHRCATTSTQTCPE